MRINYPATCALPCDVMNPFAGMIFPIGVVSGISLVPHRRVFANLQTLALTETNRTPHCFRRLKHGNYVETDLVTVR